LIGTRERTVRARFGSRAYLEAGSGPNTIVLLHGIGSRAFSWATQLDRWSDRFRILAWDAPGYGNSEDLPNQEPDANDYADALADFLDALELERPLLVGHSLGALIAGTFASRFSSKAAALVLLSVACGYGHLSLVDRERRFAPRAGDLRALGAEGLASRRSAALLSDNATPEQVARVGDAMKTVRESGYLAALRMLTNADLFAVAPKIALPALVACGSEDAVTPPDQNRRVAQAVPGAAFALVEGAGHALYVERPDELDRVVLPFFASHAGGAT
jgi:pimeloyl-ACP methyl ester carboxylesterase